MLLSAQQIVNFCISKGNELLSYPKLDEELKDLSEAHKINNSEASV